MANGYPLRDSMLTCASWDYKFNTRLRITNQNNQKNVEVIVTDRGPARRLYAQGRIIDLSRRAFSEIADLKSGVIPIRIEVIK
jgi:rare lipoprotein A